MVSLEAHAKNHEVIIRRRSWDGIDKTDYEPVHRMEPLEARGFIRQIEAAILDAEKYKREVVRAQIPELEKKIKQMQEELNRLTHELSLATEAVA